MSFSRNLSGSSTHKDYIEEKVKDGASTKYGKSCKHLTGGDVDVNICGFKQNIGIEVKFEFEDDPDLDFNIHSLIKGSNDYTMKKLKDYGLLVKQELENEFEDRYYCCVKEGVMLVNYKEVINNEHFIKISDNLRNHLYKMGCSHLDLEEFELDWGELSREFELFYSFSGVATPHTKKCEEDYDYCIDEHLTGFTNRFYVKTEDDLIDLRIIENQFKSMVKPVNCDNCSSTVKDLE